MKHVFSAEVDEAKRNYIMESFQVEHIFGDVRGFSHGAGYCWVCKREHSMDAETLDIHIFFCGPSCKDLSALDSDLILFSLQGDECCGSSFNMFQPFSRKVDVNTMWLCR